MNPESQLNASNLACIRDDRTLFSQLDFSLRSGEMLLLEGQNGSGKTSLLRILCSIRLPDEGTISWNGKDIFKLGPDYHEYITYVGHKDGVKQDLTPQENLHIAQAMGAPSESVEIEDILDQFGLYGFEDIPTRNLSAGQQRRLALARLAATNAPLWILDEPFTSLDKRGIGVFESLMDTHTNGGGMIVLTTHHKVSLTGDRIQRINLSS